LSEGVIQNDPQISNVSSDAGVGEGSNYVLLELVRQVPPLYTEEPEVILWVVSRLDEIFLLQLTDDRGFIIRLLPLFSGSVLRFFGGCLRNGRSWQQCKEDLFKKYFPQFVREWLIRDLVVFNFHHGQSVRDYIDKVFAAAKFLGYAADEQQLVDRIVMNLHPSILAEAAFLKWPHSRAQLYSAVGLIEEKFSMLKERQRIQSVPNTSRGGGSRGRETSRDGQENPRFPRCWKCGRVGHVRHHCHQNSSSS
jgi:hypothetical protein